MTKSQAQIYVVLVFIALWIIGIFVAVWDGNVMVKLMTPFMTMALGWLFTEKATG